MNKRLTSEFRSDLTASIIVLDNVQCYMEKKMMDSRFECPICLSWLRDPTLTKCGHLFCSQCIHKWLKKEGAGCPVDNVALNPERDLFRDLRTSREILQQRINCLYQPLGCLVKLSPVDMQEHIPLCAHQKHVETVVKTMTTELESDTSEKEKALMESDAKNQLSMNEDINFDGNDNLSRLLKFLFERIVTLEQQNREISISIGNLQSKIMNVQTFKSCDTDSLLRNCNGLYIWRVDNFNQKLGEMILDSSRSIFSPGFYTSPYGYKVCARISVTRSQSQHLSIFIHMMKSENDDALDWPFNGLIYFALIHPTNSESSIREKILSRPDLDAFQKPLDVCNKRSFGYANFIISEELKNFISNDCLTLRIQIKHRVEDIN